MARNLLVKSLRAALTLWIVVTFVFIILRLTGDPLQTLLPDDTPEEILAFYRVKWGLDASLPEQYKTYLLSVLQLDFGYSFLDNRPAFELAMERFPKTILLGLAGFAWALILGLGLGTTAALWRGWLDRVLMASATIAYAMPSFFLAILMILFFSLGLRLLPSTGSETIRHLILPSLAIGLSAAASVARFTRSGLLDVLEKSFMRTARGKGLTASARLLHHAFPSAAISLLPVLGFSFGTIISGSVVVETIFAWPGMGRLFYDAVTARDFAVVQACILIVAFSVVSVNLMVDALQVALDPRLRSSLKVAI